MNTYPMTETENCADCDEPLGEYEWPCCDECEALAGGELRTCVGCSTVYALDHFNERHDGQTCIHCQAEDEHDRRPAADYRAGLL